MGNNKFKLSDMIPNAWFYKLKHMTTKSSTKRRNDKTNSHNNTNTKNYINQHHRQTLTNKKKPSLSPITVAITSNSGNGKIAAADPPRRSSKRRSTSSSSSSRRRKPAFKPRSRLISNSSSAETFSSESDSLFAASDEDDRENPTLRLSSSTADIIIDLETRHHHHHHENAKNFRRSQRCVDGIVDLPPILTKPINFDDTVFEAAKLKSNNLSVKTAKTLDRAKTSQNGRRSTSSSSAGIKLRSNSPRLACARKSVSYSRERRYLAESLAVVKSSVDPQRDFRESMVEMIVENDIRASKDLEELLACYLSLNSKQYHDVIVKAFERIWFDMAHTRIQ